MKKFIKVIVLAMAFVLVFATLASCGKNIDKIEEKAKDAGYEVDVEKLDEADEDGVVACMSIVDNESNALFGTPYAEVYEFENADAAKEAYEDAKEYVEKAAEDAEKLGLESNLVVKRSGKIVIMGDEDIVKKVW